MSQETAGRHSGGTAAAGMHEHERERHAYNLAFSELDLGWHWDEQTYAQLQAIDDEEERVRAYLDGRHGHLLKAYDAGFLAGAIRLTKSRLSS
jgi:hypothetical protein